MNQVNYQKELEKILNTLQERGEAASDYRPPRLFLHSFTAHLQQLLSGISVPLFFDHGILLQSQHFLFGRISKARGGAEASDRSL